jgi:lysophospholipase L1-like esterase
MAEIVLPAARKAAVNQHRLVVLAVGGAATNGAAAGDPAASYPAQLQSDLIAQLPGVDVRVINKGVPAATAENIARKLPALIAETRATLVIWSSGAREAASNSDIEAYIFTLQTGIAAVRRAGADVVLMDPQYAPSIARILNTAPYREALLGTASAAEVPVLKRYAMMMYWSDTGVMQFDATDHVERQRVARHLFTCLAAGLAGPIAQALR